jgi:hypothetical protein
VRALGALLILAGVPASLGGVLFAAVHGATTTTRSVAYGLWIAAAVCLVLMVVAGSKPVWRSAVLPAVEGWVFVSAAILLTAAGAAVDALGT